MEEGSTSTDQRGRPRDDFLAHRDIAEQPAAYHVYPDNHPEPTSSAAPLAVAEEGEGQRWLTANA